MGDYFPGEIEIGGQITRRRLPKLLAAINAAGVKLDYGDIDVRLRTEQEVLDALDEDGHLHLYDEAASYGHFEALETTCKDLGLSYDRRADAYGDYDAELVFLRDDQEKWYPTAQDGHVVISQSDLGPATTALREGRAAEALKLLEALQAELPPLPRFEIVDRRRPRRGRSPSSPASVGDAQPR